ncbi:SDR family NAD(P)-dependent oxidoreductase [Klebsiella quasipneumoniae]|uniref:SDR family NAD(P)-dependent oxidoreductase n=1 Tax=Klebsiella quasipneumoniae TaxID=1463165 RepID=UPI0021B19BBF|nr:SDR family oxidoreductase [Klebsiella quasipneumoniae]MCT7324032.1 SDR family oxidoreductase [Klebsiella quasipneumoniae]
MSMVNIDYGNASINESLKDKNVLIFGGGSGIGLETAIQATAAGANVIIVGRDRERTKRVADQYGFSGWRVADVTDPEAIRLALSTIDVVDHLIMLSGTFSLGKVLEADVSLLRQAYEERVWSIVHVLRTLGDKLASEASVTLVSGALTHRPDGNGTAIITSACAAVEVLGRGLALELAPRRVNVLAPGPVNTPLLYKSFGDARDSWAEVIEANHPLHRFGTAGEAASAAMFLMTNQYMNGAVLNIDGGSRL